MTDELLPVRLGIFWLLVAGFTFGNSERLLVTVQQPTPQNLGLLSVAGLCFALFLFLKPRG